MSVKKCKRQSNGLNGSVLVKWVGLVQQVGLVVYNNKKDIQCIKNSNNKIIHLNQMFLLRHSLVYENQMLHKIRLTNIPKKI